MKVKELAGNAADDLEETAQFKVNMSSLTTHMVDVVKEVGCSSTVGQTLNPKKQLEPSVFGDSSD